ncbi:hypothetical protein EJV44_02270 [Ancylobacter aquaticus]|nr:hypothetical protein EJV44_02270 [Ancylobacter aquaticus]
MRAGYGRGRRDVGPHTVQMAGVMPAWKRQPTNEQAILTERERIKRQTIQQRRLQHQLQAA